MPELVLPGVYIEVRPEALIVPGPISVGNIGIVGTAQAGPTNEMVVLSSYAQAREVFGAYDAFDNPKTANNPLSLVRALELAYSHGASTVLAVRIEDGNAKVAEPTAADLAANAAIFSISAKSKGTLGSNLTLLIEDIANSTVKRVVLRLKDEKDPNKVITEEVYLATKGEELVSSLNQLSALAIAKLKTDGNLVKLASEIKFAPGDNGAAVKDSHYAAGLEILLNEDAHIILAAGQDETVVADELKAHVEAASTDKNKRDRIAVVGSKKGAKLADIINHKVASDRLIFVAPGIKTTDAATGNPVALPGAYAAAAVAGMLSARDPHISLTNKALSVGGLETKFNPGELEQLVKNRVLGLEERRGFRVVRGITSDNAAFQQITTRRIVDYAKFGVRGAADPFIGLLNNNRVRQALKGSINGFLASMVDDEMLVSYELDVTATRDEEIRGIAKVTLTLRPTFSIDYIKVVMFLG